MREVLSCGVMAGMHGAGSWQTSEVPWAGWRSRGRTEERERVPCDMPRDKASGGSEKSGMALPVNTGQAWLFSVSSDSGQGVGKREAREDYNRSLTCSSRGVPSPLLRPKLSNPSEAEAKVLLQDNLGWGRDSPGAQAHTPISSSPQVPAVQSKSLSSLALASSSVP